MFTPPENDYLAIPFGHYKTKYKQRKRFFIIELLKKGLCELITGILFWLHILAVFKKLGKFTQSYGYFPFVSLSLFQI